MMANGGTLKSLWRLLLQFVVGAMVAPFLLMSAVMASRSVDFPPGLCSPERQSDWDGTRTVGWIETYEGWWVHQILTTSPELSWSCAGRAETLERVGKTVRLGSVALLLAASLALGLAWHEVLGWRPGQGGLRGAWTKTSGIRTVWMAPTILWASVLSTLFNLILLRLALRMPGATEWLELHLDLELQTLLLGPQSLLGLRWGAALCVLTLGGGTLWSLRTGLASDLRQLVQKEHVLSAWANGLPSGVRIARSLLPVLVGRMATRFPQLLGEVIVVEYLFYLDGVGRELVVLAEQRDAPALMTITLMLGSLSIALHGVAQVVSQELLPTRQEGPV